MQGWRCGQVYGEWSVMESGKDGYERCAVLPLRPSGAVMGVEVGWSISSWEHTFMKTLP